MHVHHVAIGVKDPELMLRFYLQLPEMIEETRYCRENGSLRSVWLRLADGILLMLEQSEAGGPRALVFKMPDRAEHRKIVYDLFKQHGDGRTDFTLYIKDPEGNRLGFSSWPRELKNE